MAVEVANDHIGSVRPIVNIIWVIKLELYNYIIVWVVDRSDVDTANGDGEYLNLIVLGHGC